MEYKDFNRILRLVRKEIERAFPNEKIEGSINSLEDRVTNCTATPSDYEQFGILNHQIGLYDELIGKINELNELVDAENDPDENTFSWLEDELKSITQEAMEFILDQDMLGEYDDHDAIINFQTRAINEGVRGYMGRLSGAYEKFAKERGLAFEVLDGEDSKNFTIRISGSYAYGLFRGEHGVHKVIYQNGKGVTHTNPFNVTMNPAVEKVPFELNEKKDLHVDTLSAGTKGGQHANKNETGIRLTYEPRSNNSVPELKGKSVTIKTRSRHNSYKTARDILFAELTTEYESLKANERYGEERPPADNCQHMRMYRTCGNKEINDKRIGYRTKDLDGFFNGDIGPFIYVFHGVRFYNSVRELLET